MISGRGNLRGNRDCQRASSRNKAKFWTPPAGPPPATLQPVKLCKAVTMDQTIREVGAGVEVCSFPSARILGIPYIHGEEVKD